MSYRTIDHKPCPRSYKTDFTNAYDDHIRKDPIRAKLYENSSKYRSLLGQTECFYAGDWKEKDLDPMFGGVYPWTTTNTIALDAARLAVSHYNELNGKNLEFEKLISVNAKMAKAIDFYLTLEVSDGGFYEAKVFHMSKDDRKVYFMRPAVHYPTISPRLHHLIGPPEESAVSTSDPKFIRTFDAEQSSIPAEFKFGGQFISPGDDSAEESTSTRFKSI